MVPLGVTTSVGHFNLDGFLELPLEELDRAWKSGFAKLEADDFQN